MSASPRFLSRLLGLFCLTAAVCMIANGATLLATVTELVHDRPLMLVVGIVTLFAGLAMVLAHNVWSGGVLTVVVTVIGWLTLAKAVVILLLSPAAMADVYLFALQGGPMSYLYTAVTAIIGVYLTYAGFRGRAP